MGILSTDFKHGYCDGHGQAIENVRFNLIDQLTEGKELTIDLVNDICDFCSKVDHDYLNQ